MLKTAKITPIYKGKDPNNVNNYTAIANVLVSKIIKTFMDWLLQYYREQHPESVSVWFCATE